MRLFVAVELDPVVVQKMAEGVEEVRRRATMRAPRARIGWVPAERLHVTVRFIGRIDEPHAEAIAVALEPEVAVKRFEVTIQGVGAFPERGAPRVIWAGITAGIESLAALEQEVTARLAEVGVPCEERPYRPHVTLGRVREATGLRSGPLLDGLSTRRFGTSRVEAITLFQSRPSPQGHLYVPLQRTPLAPAGPPSAGPALRT